MDILNTSTKNLIPTIIYLLPLLWGIYEFKKFNENIKEVIKLIKDFNQKVEDNPILKNNPFIKNVIDLTEKFNQIINVKNSIEN